MIIDNLITNALTKELKQNIEGGKIERIAQLSKDTFALNVWNKKLFKLVISLNSNTYRICFTEKNYKLNNQGSTFFNHLKKAIESGTITEIEQINFDRIINLKIESFDNVKDKIAFNLIIELTGKYSNMILLDQNKTIIGCHKLVDLTQSEERNVLLGEKYEPITNKDNKIEIQNLELNQFSKLIETNNLSLKNFLIKKFLGISTHTSKILLKRLGKDYISSNEDVKLLYEILKDFSNKITNDNLNLEFFLKEDNGQIKEIDFDFSNNQDNFNQSISKFIDRYYQDKDSNNDYRNLENHLKKIVEKNLNKINEKIESYQNQLLNSENFEIFKQYGELIFSNIYKLPQNAKSIELENYYDNNKMIKITLNENKTISENAQIFFKNYNKLKTGIEMSQKIIESLSKEVDYLEEINVFIENSESIEHLKEIEEELNEGKYVNKFSKAKIKKKKIEKVHLLNFRTSSDLEILVGKNNTQNDFLTTKLASNNDLWLHTRLIPGSHVVIRTENGQKKITDKDIIEAAILAAKHSKAKMSNNVCVIYTKIKNVKKPSGAKPGLVIYQNEKAVYVNPN